MLADFSVHGEAWREECANKSVLDKLRGAPDWGRDKLDVNTDEPTDEADATLSALVKVLRKYFAITTLGGHREFQKVANGDGRACPGTWGMIPVELLRKDLKLGAPAPRPAEQSAASKK